MKRAIIIIAAVILALSGFEVNAALEDHYDFMVDGIYYDILSEEEKTVGVVDPYIRDHWETGAYMNVVTVPPSVEYEGTTYRVAAFMECYWCHVRMISLPDSLDPAYPISMSNLSDLVYIELPKNLETLTGPSDCRSLPALYIPPSVKAIARASISRVGVEELWIPQNVKTIGDYSIRENERLRDVFFDNHVSYGSYPVLSTLETIGSHCFCSNPLLSDIVLPESLRSVGEDCFNDCPSMTLAQLPATDLSLTDCFNGCPAITTLCVTSYEPYPFPETCFLDVDRSKCRLLVPDGSEELYMEADGWKDFYVIVGDPTLSARAPSVSRVSGGQAYNLDGTPKPTDEKGIAIQDGKVIIRK